jgi:hypothetical protein
MAINSLTRLQKNAHVWTDPEAFGAELLLVALDEFGADVTMWTPETIAITLEETYNVPLNALAFDKLMAAITIVSSDDAYQDLDTFLMMCNVLTGTPYDPVLLDLADADECAWGLCEAMLLTNDATDPIVLDDEITGYIQYKLMDEGLIHVPRALQPFLGDWRPPAPSAFADGAFENTVMTVQTGRTKLIDDYVGERMFTLTHRISNLQLRRGDSLTMQSLIEGNLNESSRSNPTKPS